MRYVEVALIENRFQPINDWYCRRIRDRDCVRSQSDKMTVVLPMQFILPA